jgi:hypothetical protein
MRTFLVVIMIILVIAVPILGCSGEDVEAVPFSIQVKPAMVTHAYSGQAYIFSVLVLSDQTGRVVNISASNPDCDFSLNPKSINPGEVSRISVVPGPTSVGKILTIAVEGERDGLVEQAEATIEMGDTGDSGEGV